MAMTHFADRLTLAIRATKTPLCIGLDPFAALIPSLFGDGATLSTLEAFFGEVVAQVAGKVAVIKPQLGLFEPWGGAGIDLVARLCASAKAQGLLVILDAKRGDIGSTAEGYARAYLGPQAVVDCDALTINPYMGLDTLAPFADVARAQGKGIAVLVRTSNPGAKDFQDLQVDGAPLWTHVGMGFSSLMVVCGATWPHEAKALRAILPKTLFLVPGYGAQGAGAADALAGLVRGPTCFEGGVIASSRAVLYPKACGAASSLAQWRTAFAANLQAVLDDVARASEHVV
jgi:orotidine-5'-phosphate decarboxylase